MVIFLPGIFRIGFTFRRGGFVVFCALAETGLCARGWQYGDGLSPSQRGRRPV